MKRLVTSSALLCLAATLWSACSKPAVPASDSKDEKAPAPYSVERDAGGNAVLTLNSATQTNISLQIAPLVAGEKPSELMAYGSILDPAPLLALQNDLAIGSAALAASEQNLRRASSLFQDNENVPRKTVEAAETETRGSQLKLNATKQAIQLAWGDAIASLSPADFQKLGDDLIHHRAALARVDLPADETLSNQPAAARLAAANSDHWAAAAVVSTGLNVDPKTLGQGFLLRLDNPDPALAPGAAVKAALQTSVPPVHGVIVPDSAVLRFEARAWVYLASPENKFMRREIVLDTFLTNGWFIASGLSPGEKIVVEGAQILLSEEQKSQFEGGD